MCCRQRSELDELRRQLEENSSVAGRTLREELDKTREEQERRHQVRIVMANLTDVAMMSIHTV